MHLNQLRQLVKECVLEVLREELTQSDFDKKVSKPNKKEIPIDWDDESEDGEVPIEKECFDPLSQGPNPDNKENPYPEWNSKMRTMENEHGRYAQESGAGQFDPRTFGKLDEKTCQCKKPSPCAKDKDTMYCGQCMKWLSHKQKKKHFGTGYTPHVGDN